MGVDRPAESCRPGWRGRQKTSIHKLVFGVAWKISEDVNIKNITQFTNRQNDRQNMEPLQRTFLLIS
jgi:hypothetical protein